MLVPKAKHLAVQDGDFIKRGEYLMDGNPAAAGYSVNHGC